jgi:excisionase family DNA binding protein
MIEDTDEVLGFVMRYLRPFCKRLHEAVGQTWHPDRVGVVAGDPLVGTIYEVFGLLKKHYGLQERWKGGTAYIWRVVRHLGKKSGPKLVAHFDPETAVAIQSRRERGYGRARRHEESPETAVTADAAVRCLATRGLSVSRETLYRWIREKKIYATQKKRKRILLDETALEQAAALARLHRSRLTGH